MTDDAQRRTLSVYDEKGAEYAELGLSREDLDDLHTFAGRVTPRGAVLDFGCGAAHASGWLAERGFAMSAIDGSATLAEEARKRYQIHVRVMRFEDFRDPPAYDGVWAAHTLHHLPPESFLPVLTAIQKSLKPDGQLYLAVKGGDGSYADGLGRLYTYSTEAELKDTLAEAELVPVMTRTYSDVGFDGTPCEVIAIFAKKAA